MTKHAALLFALGLLALAVGARALDEVPEGEPAPEHSLTLGHCAATEHVHRTPDGGIYVLWACTRGHLIFEHVAGPKPPLAPRVKPRGPRDAGRDPFGPGPKHEI